MGRLSEMNPLKNAFNDRPQDWGHGADAHLWDELARLSNVPAIASLQQIHAHLLDLFAGLTGSSLDANFPTQVDRYKATGEKDGPVSPQFWAEKAIPLLLRRCASGHPLSVMCWNVNHRTGRTPYQPAAVTAAMATDADVLVFTEFFPQGDEARVKAELLEGGWVHQALSRRAKVRANQILVASRKPLVLCDLPPSPVDEHLLTNTLRIQVDGALEMLCSRVPTYTGVQRAAAWDWLVSVAESVRQHGPSMLIGDLNTGLRAKPPMPQFLSLCESWTRLQPAGLGSFFGKGGIVSEIDHALVTGPLDATAWYLRQAGEHTLAGNAAALSDHAALFVQLDLRRPG